MRRYEIMEIKHSRAAMLGFLHVIAIERASACPATVDLAEPQFSGVPAGTFASLEAVSAGWLQIMVLTCMQEAGAGFASKPQTDDAEAGDIALDRGCTTTTPGQGLQAERRAPERPRAMMGITGCLVRAARRRRALPHRRLGAALAIFSACPLGAKTVRCHDLPSLGTTSVVG